MQESGTDKTAVAYNTVDASLTKLIRVGMKVALADGAKLQKIGDEALSAPTAEQAKVVKGLVKRLKDAGIPTHLVTREGQKKLDEAFSRIRLSKAQKRTLETARLNSQGEGTKGTVVSSVDGAKVLKNLDTLAEKIEKSSQKTSKTFIGDLAKALEAEKKGSKSEYATFVTPDGKEVTIRLADHNATVSNFDHNDEDDGISIVIAKKRGDNKGIDNDGNAHIVEYFYTETDLRKQYGKPLADIVRSVKDALNTGEYTDPLGIAEREEVNAEQIQLHKVFHGSATDFERFDHSHMGEGDLQITDKTKFYLSPDGEVIGYTVDGEIWIDPRYAKPDTPVHEYTHLWADALERSNPEAFKQLVDEMRKETELWEYVRGRYPEIKNESELAKEVFAHYSGKRGRELLESEMREEMAKADDLTLKAKVATMFHKLRSILTEFWNMSRQLFAGKVEGIERLKGEDFADMALNDLLRGFDPRGERTEQNEDIRWQKGREDVEAVNSRFNEELQKQIDGTLPQGHVYDMGVPNDILLDAGIPNLPIELAASRLVDKSMQDNHPFDISEVRDLPRSIHNPLAVFRSATHPGSYVILTELKHGNRSFVVAMRVNNNRKKMMVNDIRSVHYRTGLNIVNWINEELGEYYREDFENNWLEPLKKELRSKPQYNSAEVRTKLNLAAKIRNCFDFVKKLIMPCSWHFFTVSLLQWTPRGDAYVSLARHRMQDIPCSRLTKPRHLSTAIILRFAIGSPQDFLNYAQEFLSTKQVLNRFKSNKRPEGRELVYL